jgi:beta-ureidopropionase
MSTQSRRRFLTTSMLGLGAATRMPLFGKPAPVTGTDPRLPREVWIASFGQQEMGDDDPAGMMDRVLSMMEGIAYQRPDIICLPEAFPYAYFRGSVTASEEALKSDSILRPFAEFAHRNRCCLICPIYTNHEGRLYNAAVVIDRNGEVMGEYWKMHPTEGEIAKGITPGPLDPPVFKTDFGVIGVQICFDINWQDGWEALRRKGAEIIFWPSAFGGGQEVNTKAWLNKCCVVSSTRKGTTKICDVDGTEVAATGHWNRQWAIGPVNLEKAFIHTWPYWLRFREIEKKYGRDIRIRNHHEEEWSILESLSPDVHVQDILTEFDIKTHEEHIASAESLQVKHRP